MSRNGSGVYSLPAGQPVVTGTTISSATHNALMADIAAEITRSIASDGQTVPTANLPMGGFKLTGLAAGTVSGDSVRYEQFISGSGATGTWGISISGNAATATLATAANNGVPVGSVVFFCASSAPTGFIKANGAAVSRTTYASLFAAIGTAFGAGDWSTTFNLPDLRGEFVRGWDDARGVDSGRAFASTQDQSTQPHTHSIRASIAGFTNGNPGVLYAAGDNNGNTLVLGGGATYGIQNNSGTETRPRNVALLACIKY